MAQENNHKDLKKHFEKSVEKIDKTDVEYALKKGTKKFEEHNEDPPKPLSPIWDKILLMLNFLSDVFSGRYKEVPWKTIAAISGAILYFANPMDLVPDFIPGLGFLDDASVIGFALKLVDEDLKKYQVWKEESSQNLK